MSARLARARIREGVRSALAPFRARVAAEAPPLGQFPLIEAEFAIEHPDHPVASVTLRVGPAQSSEGQSGDRHKRYLDVRVATKGKGSESSSWILYADKDDIIALLSDEDRAVDVIGKSVDEAIDSLRRHDLR